MHTLHFSFKALLGPERVFLLMVSIVVSSSNACAWPFTCYPAFLDCRCTLQLIYQLVYAHDTTITFGKRRTKFIIRTLLANYEMHIARSSEVTEASLVPQILLTGHCSQQPFFHNSECAADVNTTTCFRYGEGRSGTWSRARDSLSRRDVCFWL